MSALQVTWFFLIGVLLTGYAILDGFDNDLVVAAFNRDGTSKAYAESLTPEDSYRNSQAAKVQGDVLSAMERDWRMRTRPRVRMIAHALSRTGTHSLAAGPIQGNILQYVRILVDSGPSEDSNG